jgi:hypothetical protein
MNCSVQYTTVHYTTVVTAMYFVSIIDIYSYPHNDTVKILDIARKSKSAHEQSLLI